MDDLDTEEIIENSDDEGEAMTAAEVLQKLEELWINEKMSPALQKHRSDIVECILAQINQMNINLKKCKSSDLRLPIHKMEIDRIRYILCSYLRKRLSKIGAFTHHLIKMEQQITDSDLAIMSEEEKKYAVDYASSLDEHFHVMALQYLPEKVRQFGQDKMLVKPNLDAYVFFKVKEYTPGLLIQDLTEEEDEEVDLEVGAQHLMRYTTVKHLLDSGAINLI